VPRRAHAADRVAEQCVAGEDVGPADEQRQHAAGVARRVQRADGQPADLELLAGAQVPGGPWYLRALVRVDQHRGVRPAPLDRVQLRHVVVVVVREQHVGDRHAVLVGRRQERLDRAAGVDQEAVRARSGRHQVGVRQPLRVHRALEDHEATVAG
jgi:hypothetical protein